MTVRKQKKIEIPVAAEESTVVSVPVKTTPRKRRARAVRRSMEIAQSHDVVASDPSAPADPSQDKRFYVWLITGLIMVAIIGAWVMLFRWNTRGAMKDNAGQSLNTTKDELKKTVDEFQKNFGSITKMIEERFTQTTPDEKGSTKLSPEALRELQNRLQTAGATGTVQDKGSGAPAAQGVRPVIDWDIKNWQPYATDDPPMQLRYPNGWILDIRAVEGDRLVAFAPQSGGILQMSELFIDVRENLKRKTLKEFYTEQNRTNLYQSARGGTETVYVDGIRAIQFNDVAQVLPTTIVSVRSGTKVYEFSVLGTDAEHLKLLQTLLSTVQFK